MIKVFSTVPACMTVGGESGDHIIVARKAAEAGETQVDLRDDFVINLLFLC